MRDLVSREAGVSWETPLTLVLLATALFVCGATLLTSQAEELAYDNLLIIFDSSGSMAEPLEGEPKIDVARRVVQDLVMYLPSDMTLGVLVYGASPRRKRDCDDIRMVRDVAPPDPAGAGSLLDGVRPLGMTPIASALRQGAGALASIPGRSAIVLVTDGEESCDGDPCAVARDVRTELGIDVKIHVVGLALGGGGSPQLECVAKGGGGKYYPANSSAELRSAITEAIKAPLPTGGQAPMWWSILHPGLGEWKNSGKSFEEGCPPRKFWLGMIPGFGWPGYLQVVSAIDAYHGRTNDWGEPAPAQSATRPPVSAGSAIAPGKEHAAQAGAWPTPRME